MDVVWPALYRMYFSFANYDKIKAFGIMNDAGNIH
jgi:hypothetical protein